MSNLTLIPKKKAMADALPKLDKKAIQAFLQANTSVDLKKLNTFSKKRLEGLSWGKQEQSTLLSQLKALQRLVRLTDSLETAEVLYEHGLHAAVQIADIPQHKFIEAYAALFTPNGLSNEEQAKKVHKRALARKSKAVLTYTAIAQHKSAHYRATRFDNISAATDSNYNNLPSYQDLFGELDYCSCTDCRSIFSPAAYFVDLMRLQDKYIGEVKTPIEPSRKLQDRRPDLWNLVLNCDNTNNLVPKLRIVNEVLLNTINSEPEGNDKLDKTTYETLANTNYPFNLPFHLPLTEINLYLDQHKQTLANVWQKLNPNINLASSSMYRQSLKISPEQWKLYSTPVTDAKLLAVLYGLPEVSDKELIEKLTDVDTFLNQTGLSYVQLQELIYEDLSEEEIKNNLNADFFINRKSNENEIVEPPISIENTKDEQNKEKTVLKNLTIYRLDRINRFIRLAQALSWSFTDLDWTLRVLTIEQDNLGPSFNINDGILPYLAWIQSTRQQYKLTINQICGLIGRLKDFGKKNGPTFFEQIFRNPLIPNIPDWSGYWKIPQLGNPSDDKSIQIQNALAAILKISQNDLLHIAKFILSGMASEVSEIWIDLVGLGIIYRISQLPILTGLSIKECLTANRLIFAKKSVQLFSLAQVPMIINQPAVEALKQFSQWLKTTPFSAYQLQFILTGTSEDPTIYNQILGKDKVKNFIAGFKTVIQLTLLTEDHFVTAINPILQNTFGDQTGDLGQQIYKSLQYKGDYIDASGVITQKGEKASVEDVKEVLLFNTSSPADGGDNFLDNLSNFIVNLLANSYQLQQTTLTQQLASLYNVSPNLVHVLQAWGALTLGDLAASNIGETSEPNPYAAVPLLQKLIGKSVKSARKSKPSLSVTEEEDVTKRLQLLQQYAVLIKILALSPAEANAILMYPYSFGIVYKQGNQTSFPYVFALEDIQTLYAFKKLVQDFHDTQNHLLSYFALASSDLSRDELAEKLAQITRWNVEDVQFLFKNLWTDEEAIINKATTVAGIKQLQAYFNLSELLHMDMLTLWQLTIAIDANYKTYESLANALWGGLQKQFEDQPTQLTTLQGILDETKRGALLNLVIDQLHKEGLPITTPRDLYEYLLIDVEVSGVVQISYIKEAISAIQLYIYRCLNSLESDIDVQTEIYTWWPWMQSYRVWEANREVFLYPENYIQPELRKDKTPPFTALENALQQNKLTTEVAEIAVNSYLDSFAEVATLEIVGSYLSIDDTSSSPDERTLYLAGRTTTEAYKYYYRSATFDYDSEQKTYVATQWNPWLPIDLQIKSTMVSPVYAFNRLFLFWAEAKPGPSDRDDKDKSTKNRFEVTLYYSFYDFNKRWSVPQQLTGPILLADTIKTQAMAEELTYQQVRAVFSPTTQHIYWSWGDEKNKDKSLFQSGIINQQLSNQTWSIPSQSTKPVRVGDFVWPTKLGTPCAIVYQDKLQVFFKANDGLAPFPNMCTWVKNIDGNRMEYFLSIPVALFSNPNVVFFQDTLYLFYCSEENGNNKGLWYSIYNNQSFKWTTGEQILKGEVNMQEAPSAVVYNLDGQDKLYCFYKKADSEEQELWYVVLQEDGSWVNNPVPGAFIATNPSAIVFQNTIYCFYKKDNTEELWYAVLTDLTKNKWDQIKVQVDSGAMAMLESPAPVVYKDRLYCFYQGRTAGELWYVLLRGDGLWKNIPVPDANILNSPSAVAYKDGIYCFYQGGDFKQFTNSLWYTTTWPLNNDVLEFLKTVQGNQEHTIPQIVPSLDLSWRINLGADGSQFLAIPIEGENGKNEIRLNSMVVYQLSRILLAQGMDGFLSLSTQKISEIDLKGKKTPTLDFAGANGLYYWELFFHMPFLVANSLSIQQQFESAKKWYEYIFNPSIPKKDWDINNGEEPNDKYWRFLMLRAKYNSTLQEELKDTWAEEVKEDLRKDDPNNLDQPNPQLVAYHNDPFDPHAIARLRPIAYQKTLVMHYIDNLLSWGDNLFRQYTIETLVEATMLYVMAYDLLGKPPISVGPCALPAAESISQIAAGKYESSLNKIPEFLIEIEQSQLNVPAINPIPTPHNYIPGIYFGLPENVQFIGYWDKVKQRLYNIRHNLNINGIFQQLPLFEPPINPMQLVQAVALGEGQGIALQSMQVDIPYYRFNVMVAKAQSITQLVIQFGQSLLSTLEKQDAEQLTLLYNTNQQNLLALTRTSKQDQLLVATQTIESLKGSLQNAQDRSNHYTQLLNQGLSRGEQAQLILEANAMALQISAQPIKAVAVAGYLLPNIYGLSDGGMEFGNAILQGANVLEGSAQALSMSGGLAGEIAGYQRREEDWQLQQTLAQDDMNQIQYQIVATQYQENIAQEEINLLEKQIEQEQGVQDFLKNKFTRVQLYQWMIGKISALYFQAYQLAYSVAMQAESAWQFERCTDQSFITSTYWDNLYQGLVAGEALQLDLQRMEKAYMDKDTRRLEIQKTISLARLDSKALQDLRATGTCNFELLEKYFDQDYMGHYCRQIKSISLSFPALLGPYQNVHATLTQVTNKTLLTPNEEAVKYLLGVEDATNPNDPNILRTDVRTNQQVALSQGNNDSGLFVLNFDDPRYLPFEGTGAISKWRLDMPKDCNPINFDTITDVILVMKYTALAGGNSFRDTVKQNLGDFSGLLPLSMLQYANTWYNFIHQRNPLVFKVGPTLFRPNLNKYIIRDITVILVLTPAGEKEAEKAEMPTLNLLLVGSIESKEFALERDPATGVVSKTISKLDLDASKIEEWRFNILGESNNFMNSENVSNMIVALKYTASFN